MVGRGTKEGGREGGRVRARPRSQEYTAKHNRMKKSASTVNAPPALPLTTRAWLIYVI